MKLLLAGASAIAIAAMAPAQAADLAVKAPMMAPVPAFSWSGLYLGAHVGWGESDMHSQGYLFGGAPTSYNTGSANISGLLFGGQLGYNWQVMPQLLIGVEGSISGASFNGFSYPPACCFFWSKVDALASVTGRLGWTGFDPRTQLYVKGGAAWIKNEFMFSYGLNTKETQAGWTVGGGVEWAPTFTPNMSFFAEYDFYKFGEHSTLVFASSTRPSTAGIRQDISTVKVGANYRFSLGR